MLASLLFVWLSIQGFFYDAFYGDLGLNEQHFPETEAGDARVLLLIQSCHIFIFDISVFLLTVYFFASFTKL